MFNGCFFNKDNCDKTNLNKWVKRIYNLGVAPVICVFLTRNSFKKVSKLSKVLRTRPWTTTTATRPTTTSSQIESRTWDVAHVLCVFFNKELVEIT